MFELNIIKRRLDDDRKRLILLRVQRISLLVSFVFLALLGYRYFSISGTVASSKTMVAQLKGDVDRSRQTNAVNELELEWAKHLAEINRASQVMGVRTAWGGKLAMLSQAIPRGMCIDEVTVAASTTDPAKKELVIETFILSKEKQGYELANGFIEELKKAKQFGEEIRIDNQERSNVEGKEMETVRIAVNLP